MADRSFLDWPFLEPAHRALAESLEVWAAEALATPRGHDDLDGACRTLVSDLAAGGWLELCVPASHGGRHQRLDVRSLCIARETLARHDALADFCFAMQGLGSAPISLFGDAPLKDRILPEVRAGTRIAAFALSEPDAGSDVAALATRARRDGEDYVLDGRKTFISNGGIAGHYVVFARTGEAPGANGLSAFVVEADTPGLAVAERIQLIAPHPLATLAFDGCRVPAGNMLGAPGDGFKVAMATLDIFRPTVAAAALGFARRALDAALGRAQTRSAFGRPIAEHQLIQAKIADMACAVDAAALLVYRAAWAADRGGARIAREAAMAKLFATEAAQSVVDHAVQIFGGLGVVAGSVPERLYREVRALRIYEGTSEIQRLIVANETLKAAHHRQGVSRHGTA
ncbi:MAG TPA: acyl-CoA dehydrogenase family protein [Alphaproteobacteria bacterium]